MKILIPGLLLCLGSMALAQGKDIDAVQGPHELHSTMTNDHYDFISANRLLMWVSNNGILAHDPRTSPGLQWPAGEWRHLSFMEGLVFGAVINEDDIYVGGSTYRTALQAGNIEVDGSASNPADEVHRVYKVHRFDATWWNGLGMEEQAQYLRDLEQWPVEHGAPWIDADGDGIYNPDTDAWMQGRLTDTPLFRGDEMLWWVSNDLNPPRTTQLYGTGPMGMEIQTTVWASSGHPLLDDVVFREHVLIHKGMEDISELYIGAWEDPDIGDGFNDFIGVDTARAMSYAYNALPEDQVYDTPPAAGTVWLQSPIVASPGSEARFGEEYRKNYANVPLSAYAFYVGGSSIYKDPILGHVRGAQMMLQNMQARLSDGSRYIDPVTADPVDIPLAGDPVLARDWIDGIVNAPGDRRHLSSCGPVTLAAGDTQKVVLARFVADAGNHVLSIRTLRNAARQLHDIYAHVPSGSPAPVFSSGIDFPTHDSYAVSITGGPFPSTPSLVEAVLREEDGTEIQRIALADDGMHGDGTAGDGVYGGVISGSTRPRGADLFILSTDAGGVREWFVDSELPLPGPVRLRLTDVLAENRHPDAAVNPGEHVHLGLRFENQSDFASTPLHVFLRGPLSLGAGWKVLRHPEGVAAGSVLEVEYDADNSMTHLPLTVPGDFPPGEILRLPVSIMTGDYCHWSDTLAIAVQPYPDIPVHLLLEHVEGRASGTLGATVVDGSALTEYDYRVSVEGDDIGPKTLHIENVTLGTTIRRNVPLPTPWTPHSEVIDGWRLNMGTAFDALVYDATGHRLMSFYDEYRVTGTFSEPSRSWFTVNPSEHSYTLVAGEDMLGSRLSQYDLVPVRLVFDRTHGQKAPAYLRGRPSYGYQGYYDIPVRAYDISDEENPRQVMLGFAEQSGRPSHDSTWNPTADLADREMLFVFGDDYSEKPQKKFMQSLSTAAEDMDMLYAMLPVRDEDMPMFEDGDEYTIVAPVPVSKRDVYILAKPRLLDVHSIPSRPSTTELHTNYPNPFGTGSAAATKLTTVRFSTPTESHVRLAVYDLLGRRVALLVDQALPAGTHQTQLHAGDLPSGSYIIVLDAGGERKSRNIAVLK